VAEAEADPSGPQHRRPDGDRRRLPRLGHGREDEGEEERERESPQHPFGSAQARPDDRRQRPAVPGEHERAQRAGHLVQLVQGEQRTDRRHDQERPAPVVGGEEHDRETRRGDGDPAEEGAHRPTFGR
jgi:hypothetical protein